MLNLIELLSQVNVNVLIALEICIIATIVNVILTYVSIDELVKAFISITFLSIAYAVCETDPSVSMRISLGMTSGFYLLISLSGFLYDKLENKLISSELRKCIDYYDYHITGSIH